MVTFDVDPSQNFNTGWVSVVTSHLLLDYVMDYQRFETFKGRVTSLL